MKKSESRSSEVDIHSRFMKEGSRVVINILIRDIIKMQVCKDSFISCII
jgi:hypothetical protein